MTYGDPRARSHIGEPPNAFESMIHASGVLGSHPTHFYSTNGTMYDVSIVAVVHRVSVALDMVVVPLPYTMDLLFT